MSSRVMFLALVVCLVSVEAEAKKLIKADPLEQLFEPYVERLIVEQATEAAPAAELLVMASLKRELSASSGRWEIAVERVYQGELKARQLLAPVMMSCEWKGGREGLVAGVRWLMRLRAEGEGYRCVQRGQPEDGNFWGLTPSFAEVLGPQEVAHPARRAAEAVEAKLLKALSGSLGEVRCELPARFQAGVLLWPDGRRERFMRLREHRDVRLNRGGDERGGARLSEAEAACLGRALEASRGPRFEGRAVVLNLLASGEGRREIKAWRWDGCDVACGEGELLWPPIERVLSEAMFVALVERDLRPAAPTLGHGAEGRSPDGAVDIFVQTCLLRGVAAQRGLNLSLPRSAHGWLRYQQMLCEARWGGREGIRDGSFMQLDAVASGETLELLRVLSRWDGDDVASLLKEWHDSVGFISRAELYALVAQRQPLQLEFSPWLLHARGVLLESINPARHDEAVAQVLLAARLEGDTKRAARYERLAAQMGVTPGSMERLNRWVLARDAREQLGAEQLGRVEAMQRQVAASSVVASERVAVSIWRAESRAGEGQGAAASEEQGGLTWLDEALIGAIVVAGLVLGWVVWGRR